MCFGSRTTTRSSVSVAPKISTYRHSFRWIAHTNFKIRAPDDDVLIAIDEEEAGKPVLTATFSGKRKAFSDVSLFAMLLRHPLMTVKIIAAIHYEAVRLMWKGVRRHAHGAAA